MASLAVVDVNIERICPRGSSAEIREPYSAWQPQLFEVYPGTTRLRLYRDEFVLSVGQATSSSQEKTAPADTSNKTVRSRHERGGEDTTNEQF